MPSRPSPEQVVRELIEAFCSAEPQRMRPLLDDELRAYITNRDGGVDAVGADEYLARVAAMDLPAAQFRVDVTQVVQPRPDVVMCMVDVNAARAGRRLHNHATHLFFLHEGLVAEWWMVEALPAESDAFWSAQRG